MIIRFRGQSPTALAQLVDIIRFGFAPVGSVSTVGTSFRHEFYMLMGLPVHMIRFGFMPGTTSSGGGGAPQRTLVGVGL